MIDNACYNPGETNPDQTAVCNPANNNFQWSPMSTVSMETTTKLMATSTGELHER